jgi:hypothetical protein
MLRIINTVMTMIFTRVIVIPLGSREAGENENALILRAAFCSVNELTGYVRKCTPPFS